MVAAQSVHLMDSSARKAEATFGVAKGYIAKASQVLEQVAKADVTQGWPNPRKGEVVELDQRRESPGDT